MVLLIMRCERRRRKRDGPDTGLVSGVTEEEENGGAKCVCNGYIQRRRGKKTSG